MVNEKSNLELGIFGFLSIIIEIFYYKIKEIIEKSLNFIFVKALFVIENRRIIKSFLNKSKIIKDKYISKGNFTLSFPYKSKETKIRILRKLGSGVGKSDYVIV